MSDDEFEKKALSFGKLVWGIGKDVTKAAVEVGKTVASEIDKTAKDLEKKAEENRLLEARSGRLECYLPYDMLFDAVHQELTKPIGRRGWNLSADKRSGRLQGQMSWTEYLSPDSPKAERDIHVDLTFRDSGKFIYMEFQYFIREEPVGGVTLMNLLRETNRSLRTIAEQRINTSMGDNNPQDM